jgi:hypothetical protein
MNEDLEKVRLVAQRSRSPCLRVLNPRHLCGRHGSATGADRSDSVLWALAGIATGKL